MRVGVIDVGSNTVRLLVASVGGDDVRTRARGASHLGLGEEILPLRPRASPEARRGRGGDRRVRPDRPQARRPRARNRSSPRPDARATLRSASSTRSTRRRAPRCGSSPLRTRGGSRSPAPSRARIPVKAWSPSATSAAARPRSSSGTELLGPAWVRSVDLGSLRLTAALFPSDPPTAAEIDAARDAVRNWAGRARAAATGDCARDGRQRACSSRA